MDDTDQGTRDARGFWRPTEPLTYPRVLVWPPDALGLLRWLPAYLWPWNALYLGIACVAWFWLTPPLAHMQTPELWWIGAILARNLALALILYGLMHARLYVRRAQGTAFKYDARWPDTPHRTFLFADQTLDNMVFSLGLGVPIWTAYEVATLLAMANGLIPVVDWAAHPIYCAALLFMLPLFREVHFYAVHRLLHWRPLYKTVHKLHHKNINPGPWSGLAMHPVEHLLYFSGVLLLWVVPAHPLHVIFQLIEAGLSPAAAHVGFHRVAVGRRQAIDTYCFAHYLHHRHFNCNYADGTVPLDKWLGTFNDGQDGPRDRQAR